MFHPADMPRYSISNNDAYYTKLWELLEANDKDL